jgi:hypothetical protein
MFSNPDSNGAAIEARVYATYSCYRWASLGGCRCCVALAVRDSIWSPTGGHSYSPRGIQLPLPHRDVYRHLLGAVDPLLDLSTLKLPALIERQLIERQQYVLIPTGLMIAHSGA